MIELLLQKLPTYFLLVGLAGGLVSFFAFKYRAGKRDEAFRKDAEKILDALDAERRKHAKMYSLHREIERRNLFDDAPENKK